MTYHLTMSLQQSFPTLQEALMVIHNSDFAAMKIAGVYVNHQETDTPLQIDPPSPPQPSVAPPAEPEPQTKRARKANASSASVASSATTDIAAADVSTSTPDLPGEPEMRKIMNEFIRTAAGNGPRVKALIHKHGGGALSISSMALPQRTAFFAALKELIHG